MKEPKEDEMTKRRFFNEFMLNLRDDEGTRICRGFLHLLLRNFAKRCIKYHNATEDLLYFYREKQLYSALTPALASLTDSFLTEHPVNRKPRGEDLYAGKMDFWASYRNYSFAIEIKHSFASLRSAQLSQRSVNRYKRAIRQLRELDSMERRTIRDSDAGLFLVALMFTSFFITSKSEEAISFEPYEIVEAFDNLKTDKRLRPEPNLFCLWEVPAVMQKPALFENRYESDPAVGIIGYVERRD